MSMRDQVKGEERMLKSNPCFVQKRPVQVPRAGRRHLLLIHPTVLGSCSSGLLSLVFSWTKDTSYEELCVPKGLYYRNNHSMCEKNAVLILFSWNLSCHVLGLQVIHLLRILQIYMTHDIFTRLSLQNCSGLHENGSVNLFLFPAKFHLSQRLSTSFPEESNSWSKKYQTGKKDEEKATGSVVLGKKM